MDITRHAVVVGRLEGMYVEINATETMTMSCGNDIRQVLNNFQMRSCNWNRRKGPIAVQVMIERHMTCVI
jgi:hypothetical protein